MSITECLKEFLNSEETRKDFSREEWEARKNQEIGEEIGEERGIKIGEERSLNNVAVNMLNADKPMDEITTFTGLDEEAVLELKKL